MFDKNNIMRIDFVEKIGEIELEYVALFNKTKTTEKEAQKAIQLNGIGQNNNIIIINKGQFNSVFLGE